MKILAALCCLFLSTLAATAQEPWDQGLDRTLHGTVETRTVITPGYLSTQEVLVDVEKKLTKRWGLYAYGHTMQYYSRSFVGVTYKPANWLRVGIAAGTDESRQPLRGAALVEFKHDRITSTTKVEVGKRRTRISHLTEFQYDDTTTVGVRSEPGLGVGAQAELKVQRRLSLWGGIFRDTQSKLTRFAGGMRAYF